MLYLHLLYRTIACHCLFGSADARARMSNFKSIFGGAFSVANCIKYLKQHDKHLLHAFKSCGVLKLEHIEHYISKSRLKCFIQDGYIKGSLAFCSNNQTERIYFLTDKGKKFASKHCVLGQFYRSGSVAHDIAIANYYMALPLEQRLTWITERELLNVHNQTSKSLSTEAFFEEIVEQNFSPTDGGYIRDGRLQLVEVVTRNYQWEHVLAKCLFAAVLHCRMEIIKI